jgi:hypothetical protein
MSSLLYLKDCDLGPELSAKLAPFIAAWRPHSRPPHDYELREAGYVRIEKETFVDELEEEYFEEHGYYPDENPELDNN